MADDKRLERIEVKVDDINDHLSTITVTLAAQHISLKEHIRRTELLEKDVAPIKRHVNMVQGAAALIALIATIAAIIRTFRS
jgi:archaellum component FlaC